MQVTISYNTYLKKSRRYVTKHTGWIASFCQKVRRYRLIGTLSSTIMDIHLHRWTGVESILRTYFNLDIAIKSCVSKFHNLLKDGTTMHVERMSALVFEMLRSGGASFQRILIPPDPSTFKI